MKLLFVKNELAWPRASGHDVHSYNMMRALAALGFQVVLATKVPVTPEAAQGLLLEEILTLDQPVTEAAESGVSMTRMQRRFCSYWGISDVDVIRVRDAAIATRADAVVAVGLEALPYLAGVRDAARIWYAADEWFLHHLSIMRLREPSSWASGKMGVIKLLYERAFASVVDRAWVVTDADRATMRMLAGMRRVDVLPNGVDSAHFHPIGAPAKPRTCVFWGRLDFEPNLQGLQWFCGSVWPRIRREIPDAELAIAGFNPTQAALDLAHVPGVTVRSNVEDLRSLVQSCAVAVMPMITGGGIKNKILEAAAMGMPVVCTRRACGGLIGDPPFLIANDPSEWLLHLTDLWQNASRREQLGARARRWVMDTHSWEATADQAGRALSSGSSNAARR